MKISLLRFFSLFLALLLFHDIYSQKYVVKTYTIEDGLPTRNINDACQDSNGIMWFATGQGISSYDGFSFTNFDKTHGLPDQFYRKIKIDEKGVVWALPDYKVQSIVYYSKKRWQVIPIPAMEEKNFRCNTFDIIYKNGDPIICMGSYDGYYIYENKSWTHYKISENTELNYVYTVIAYNQKFYLATKLGLCIIENGKPDWQLNKLIESYGKDIIAINIENKNTPSEKMWVLTEKWLGYIQQNKFFMVTDKFQLPHPTIFYYSFLKSDKKGNIIFGNIWAKYYITKTNFTPMPLMVNNGFSSDGATSVYIDREQNIWFTDTRGINKINNLKIVNYFEKNGMLEDEVTAISEMNDGKIVLAHNIGLSVLEKNKFQTIQFPASKINTRRVQDMIKDNKGNIWFVSISLGLGRLGQDGNMTWYYSEKHPTYTAVHQDNNGKIWVGADRRLLYVEGDKLIEEINYKDTINTIRRIFSSDSGGILIAGLEGLWLYKNGIAKKVHFSPDKISDNIYFYYRDKRREELIGSINGLCTFRNDSIVKYNKNGIDIDTPVYFILQDNEANYWLGSNQGLYKWDGKKTIETYNVHNGLAGWETNRAAGMLDSKGRIWVGTDRGLTCFEPEYDKVNIPIPVINLMSVEDSKGTHHDMTKKSSVSFNDNTLIFHFRGISFVNEGLIQYKYKLEGFDKEWQEVGQSMLNNIKYIGLRPGKYTFCVMAKNFSGNWSEVSRSEVITITQPFYLTWWFIVLVLLAMSTIIYGVIRYYFQKAQNSRLEKEIIERKRVEQDLLESKQKYHDLIELLPETIFESDCKGIITYINSTGSSLFGYSPATNLPGVPIQKLIAPDDESEITELINTIHTTQLPVRSMLTGIRNDGSLFPLSIHMVPIINKGECAGSRGIIIDMTEQKRYEDQLQKNAADLKALNASKDKFFSIIAHDLRSPFTSFLGFTEILDEELDTLPENELQEIISSLRASASNLYQLLENLLQWSLLQRDIIKFEPRTMPLNILVNNCLEVIAIPAKQKEIEIRNNIPYDIEITTDIHMLQTIIRNLVSNSIKFTKRGGYVQITANSQEEHFITIAVKDTGIGISAERQMEIFRLDVNNKTKGTDGELSTGLGLILCKEFVEKLGGKIRLESTEGIGSTFYFTIKKI